MILIIMIDGDNNMDHKWKDSNDDNDNEDNNNDNDDGKFDYNK